MTVGLSDLFQRLRQQPLLLLTLVVVFGLLVYYGIVGMQLFDGIERASALRQQAEVLAIDPVPLPAGSEGVEAEIESRQQALEAAQRGFELDHGDSLVSLLSTKAESAGVQIVSMSIGAPANVNEELFRFNMVSVSLNVQGPVDSTLFFLDILQDALPVTRVSVASFGALETPLPWARIELKFIVDPVANAELGAQAEG